MSRFRNGKSLINQALFLSVGGQPVLLSLASKNSLKWRIRASQPYPETKGATDMSENRKYYYLKLKENFFTTEKMVILESAQDGLLYSNLLLKMYLMSLKHNGVLMLWDGLPHTTQTIATFTRHQIGTVERALKLFTEFGFVEVLTDGAYYMADIQLFDRPVLH